MYNIKIVSIQNETRNLYHFYIHVLFKCPILSIKPNILIKFNIYVFVLIYFINYLYFFSYFPLNNPEQGA